MNSLTTGQTIGDAAEVRVTEDFHSRAERNRVEGSPARVLYWGDMPLASYDWTTWIREMRIEIAERSEFSFTALVHFVVETPVAAAQDHPSWPDCTLTWTLFTGSDAKITAFSHTHRRGCGKYLYEPVQFVVTSTVAHPVSNIGNQAGCAKLQVQYATRVTAC